MKESKMITPADFKKTSTPILIQKSYDWGKQSRGDVLKFGTHASTSFGLGTGIQDTDSVDD